MIWVAIANTNSCRIYDYDKNHSSLSLLKEISHPELRLKTGDTLTSDRPGHYQAGISARGAYAPDKDPKEVAIDRFSRQIAEELDKGRRANSYDKLIIITAPHMNGLLFNHLNKHIKDLVTHNIQKDIHYFNKRELIDFLKIHTQYPNES